METPWMQCKVGFMVDCSDEAVWLWLDRNPIGFPMAWELIETDNSGARTVAVFDVDGVPSIEDGKKVKAILDSLSEG